MSVETVEQRVERFSYRLRHMFPGWTRVEADCAARRLVENADQISFQLEAEAGLADIPIVEVHA